MPKSKKEGLFLSLIMSLIMIYVMAALNNDVKIGSFAVESWLIALQRLPLGFLVGILCDLCVCTPLSRKLVAQVSKTDQEEFLKTFFLRFCMVVFMTIAMTIFGIIASGEFGMEGVYSFFKYLPYNFTIALPIQMVIVAPISYRIARKLACVPIRETTDENA